MNAESPENTSDRHQNELRARFREARELLRELRGVLRPEPLPQRLERRIAARLDEQARAGPPVILRPFRLAGVAAAAAALALAVVGPWNAPRPSRELPIALSATDADDIVAAWALLGWSGPLDDSIERVTTELDDVDRRIERGPGARSGLPWAADDDWDAPVDDRNTSSLAPYIAWNRVKPSGVLA